MGYRITDAVTDVLTEMHFLRPAFQRELVNFSALARLIQPLVEERVGSKVGFDAVIMGIRRYASTMSKERGAEDLSWIIKDCTLTLRTDLSAIYYRQWRTPAFMKGLHDLQVDNVDWNAGEKLYVIHRAGEMAIIANTKFIIQLEAITQNTETKIIGRRDGLAVVTVSYPLEGLDTPGIFAYMTQQLASVGINLLAIFTTYRKASFLIEEKQVSKAYERISNSIAMSRRLQQVLAPTKEPATPVLPQSDLAP